MSDNLKKGAYKTMKVVGKWIAYFLIGIGMIFGGKYLYDKKIEEVREDERRKTIDELKDDEPDVIVTPEVIVDVDTLLAAISPAAELVTTNYYYSAADVFEKDAQIWSITIPLTKDKTVFMYDGVIKIGIKDINDIRFEINNDKKTIVVNMPKNVIISHDIDDDMQTITVSNSLVTAMDLDDYNELRNALKEREELKLKAREEYWSHIRSNTEEVIKGFIAPFTEGYEISFKWSTVE